MIRVTGLDESFCPMPAHPYLLAALTFANLTPNLTQQQQFARSLRHDAFLHALCSFVNPYYQFPSTSRRLDYILTTARAAMRTLHCAKLMIPRR